MSRRDWDRDDYDDARSEAFRCPGCEINNGTGRLCLACLDDEARERKPLPTGGTA